MNANLPFIYQVPDASKKLNTSESIKTFASWICAADSETSRGKTTVNSG
jgi:hypothetical protein